ncbi:MAG: hypothetical protein LBM01_02545 [Christensenellaceae bacterium]|jgi:hypothetical protein|nr:hypothetical protein [Christensenellaceae bacterium]
MKKFFSVFVLVFATFLLTACSGEGVRAQIDGAGEIEITTKKSVFFTEQTVLRTIKDLAYIRENEALGYPENERYSVSITMPLRASEYGNAEVLRTEDGHWQYTFRAATKEELETITLLYRTANTPIWYAIALGAAILTGLLVYFCEKNKKSKPSRAQ